MNIDTVIRIARPTDNLQEIAEMYMHGPGFELLSPFKDASSFNPYWGHPGKTFEDIDCYRVVIENDNWNK